MVPRACALFFLTFRHARSALAGLSCRRRGVAAQAQDSTSRRCAPTCCTTWKGRRAPRPRACDAATSPSTTRASAPAFFLPQAPRLPAVRSAASQVTQVASSRRAGDARTRARRRLRRAGARTGAADAQQMRGAAQLRFGWRRARGEAAAAPFRAPSVRIRIGA